MRLAAVGRSFQSPKIERLYAWAMSPAIASLPVNRPGLGGIATRMSSRITARAATGSWRSCASMNAVSSARSASVIPLGDQSASLAAARSAIVARARCSALVTEATDTSRMEAASAAE
jgi:hypothetical protein